MKNIITILALSTLLIIPSMVQGNPVKYKTAAEPAVPVKVLTQFESLVSELVTTHFGNCSFETYVTWTFSQGRWIVNAEIMIGRSSGISILSEYRPNGNRILLEYFVF